MARTPVELATFRLFNWMDELYHQTPSPNEFKKSPGFVDALIAAVRSEAIEGCAKACVEALRALKDEVGE